MNWQKMTAEERLWARVDRRGPDECWPFIGATKHHPYGQIRVDGKDMSPARFAYILAHGDVPPDKDVCHTCDNPPCCNDAHLFEGTHTDNMRDKQAKHRGNQPHGEAHHRAVFTEEDIRTIRALREKGVRQTELAVRYGVAQSHISMICTRRIWGHVV